MRTTNFKALAQNIDTEIVEVHVQLAKNAMKRDMLAKELRKPSLTDEQISSYSDQVNRAWNGYHHLREQATALEGVHAVYNWNRAYIVSGGHVHNVADGCPGFKYNTQVFLLPECSALTEAEIVELAGDRACTHCYPSAPLSALQQASKLFAPDEQEQREQAEQRKTERETKAAAKEAKKVRVLLPHGEYGEGKPATVTFGSVVSARTEAMDDLWWALFAMDNEPDADRAAKRLENFDAMVAAIAAHRDSKVTHVDELEAELVKKVGQKYIKGLTTRSIGFDGLPRPQAIERYNAAKARLDALRTA